MRSDEKVENTEETVNEVSDKEVETEEVSEDETDPIAQLLAAQEAARKMQEARMLLI